MLLSNIITTTRLLDYAHTSLFVVILIIANLFRFFLSRGFGLDLGGGSTGLSSLLIAVSLGGIVLGCVVFVVVFSIFLIVGRRGWLFGAALLGLGCYEVVSRL